MKNNKLKVTLGIIIGILVLLGASYLGRSISNRQNKPEEGLNNGEIQSDFTLDGNTCHDRSKYFVITRADTSLNAGDDILVKYKVSENNKIDCNYLKGDNDFELLNTPVNAPSSRSQYFSSINDNLLIVDEGTGTTRSFKIYDLDKRALVFGDTYSAGLFDLQNGVLNYWHKTNDVPNKLNCAKIDEYNKMGGAKIEAKISLNISNPKDREFNEFRCSYAE
jgi:hypothetical protein